MKTPKILALCLLGGIVASVTTPSQAAPETVRIFSSEGSFDDVVFEVENGIVNRGYVVDYVAHIGTMLERTAADVGATGSIYRDARALQFCSAVISRKAMEADPTAIAFCPYSIFIYERADNPGTIYVGCRLLPVESNEALSAVNDLLASISREASNGIESSK